MIVSVFLIVFYLIYGWILFSSAKHFKLNTTELHSEFSNNFSVIVPFRNEEKNIAALVESLAAIDYPQEKVEFIFVNDHSTDKSQLLLIDKLIDFPFRYQVLINQGNGKKPALNTGILQSTHDYIFTTDADCIHHPDILKAYDLAIITNQTAIYAGPVRYYKKGKNTIADSYQIIENAGMIVFGTYGIKNGDAMMTNGANLCFEKQAYFIVKGYEGSEKIPGGDDQFLVSKMLASGLKITSVNSLETLIDTTVQENLQETLQQRVRWASKLKFSHKKGFILQAIITICFLLTFINATALLYAFHWWLALLPLLLKIIFDYIFYRLISVQFGFKIPFLQVISASIFQLIFIPIVAWFALFGNYSWKNREY